MLNRRRFITLIGSSATFLFTASAQGNWWKRFTKGVKQFGKGVVNVVKPIVKWGVKVAATAKMIVVDEILNKIILGQWYYELNWNWFFTRPTFIRFGENLPGDPVYFVNGMFTNRDMCRVSLECLS